MISVIMMIYPRLVLIIGAVILLSATPTLCQVSFSQGSSTAEPLSVDSTISYSIPITNEKSSTLDYSVTLKVGPDKDNQSISLEQTKSDIFVDPHQTKTLYSMSISMILKSIKVSLTNGLRIRMMQGSGRRPGIEPKSVNLENNLNRLKINGHPLLMKTIFEYSDAECQPKTRDK